MIRAFSCSFALALLVTGCDGFTKVGEGDMGGGAGMATGGSGGGSSGSGGGNADAVCDGKPCGATCSRSNDVAGYCDGGGHCSLAYPLCEAQDCQSAADCPQPGAPCQECADGSLACPLVDCVGGQCVGSFPTCSASTCEMDADCPQSLAPCQACADGSTACPWSRCENGSCVSGIDSCPGDDPCAGKSCGDTCSTCNGTEPCAAVVMYCDENQTCQYNSPACDNPLGCTSDADCPGVGACPQCPDGMSCAELHCVDGSCQFQCETETGVCSIEGAGCANGEECCSGLTCCSGVPTPPGEEYCGTECPISDRNLKQDFASVDQTRILEKLVSLPISSWAYKTELGDERHIGPMAQDFMATFGLGSSDRTILQVDADGVTIAAIQALHARLEALEQQNAALKQELERLKSEP